MSAGLSPEALAALEAKLADPAGREDAARQLVAAHRESGDHQKLLGALDVLATAAADPLERARALQQAAQVQLENLDQPDLALATLARALEAAPAEAALYAAGRKAAERAEALDTWSEILNDLLDSVPADRSAAIHRELAELTEHFGDSVAALQHLAAAADADPKDLETLRALQRYYRSNQKWAALAECLEKIAKAVADPAQQLAAWREAASVHLQELDDPESALHCWRAVLERDRTDAQARAALRAIAVELDLPAELAFVLQIELQEAKDPARAHDLAVELATLELERTGEPASAFERCRGVLAEDPAHSGARKLVESLVTHPGPDGAAAMQLLDAALEKGGDHAARGALRERRLAAASDAERPVLYRELLFICERLLGEKERAFLAGLKAFAEGVDRATLHPILERLGADTDSLEELAEVFESTADELAPGDPLLGALFRSSARIREKVGEAEAAERLWNDLLAEAPNDPEALAHLAHLYEAGGNPAHLAVTYAKQATAAADPKARAELLLKASAAHEDAGEIEPALQAGQAACALTPTADALARLERLLGRAGKSAEQLDVLGRLVQLARDPATRRTWLLRRALLLEKEGQGYQAIETFELVLQLDGEDAEAIAGLERLLERDDVCEFAAALLEPVYARREDHRSLAELVELHLERAEEGKKQPLYDRLADLRDALGEHALAFAARSRAFALAPADPALRERLERAAQASGAFDELVAAYEERLEAGAAEPLATELWRRVAALYAERLGRPELAARAWGELARRDPKDLAVTKAWVEALRQGNNFKALVGALGRLAALEAEPEAQAAALYEAAEIAEESLGDKPAAAACYREILKRQPSDRGAIKLLERLLGELGAHEELAGVLERDAQLAAEAGAADEAADQLGRLAILKLDELDDPKGALKLARQVLAARAWHPAASEVIERLAAVEGPAHDEAALLLETALEGGGSHDKLVEMLEGKVQAAKSPAERVVLLRKIAGIRAGPQQSPELGFLAAARALRETPGDEASLKLCLDLADSAGAEEELVALLEELAPQAVGTHTRASLFGALARLQLADGDDDGAEASLRELLEVAPADAGAYESLDALYARNGKSSDRARLLRSRAASAASTGDRVSLLVRVALTWEEAGELDSAVDALSEAYALEARAEALFALERIYGRLGRHTEQAEVLSRLEGLVTEPAEVRRVLASRAEALARGGNPGAAAATYGELLGRWPEDEAAIAGLERLVDVEASRAEAARLLEPVYRARGDQRRRVEALEARVEAVAGADRVALLTEIASLREAQGDLALAFAARRRLFAEAPQDEALRERFEALAEQAGCVEELVAAYQDQLERGGDEKLAVALWRSIAVLQSAALDDDEAAVAAWEEVARRLPDSAEPLERIAALHRARSLWRPLVEILWRQADRDAKTEDKLRRLHEALALARGPLLDTSLAVRCARAILAVDPRDRAAAEALGDALAASGDRAALAAALEERLRALGDEVEVTERAALRLQLANLKVETGDPAGATALFAKALQDRPGEPQAMDGLERIAGSEAPCAADAAAALEAELSRSGQNARLVQLLERHASLVDGAARAELLARAAQLSVGELDDPLHALLLAGRALRDAPEDAALLARCRELAAEAEAQAELCALLEEVAPLAHAPAARSAMFRALAEEQEKADELEDAADSWRQVLALGVEPDLALSRLEELLSEDLRWAELGAAYAARLASVDAPAERARIGLKLAAAREKANDLDGAVEALQDAWGAEPRAEPLEALERLYAQAHRFLEQAEVLDKLAGLAADPDAKCKALLRRAEALRRAGSDEPALEALSQVLVVQPRSKEAIAAVEPLLASNACQARAAALLEPIWREAGEREKLAAVLEVRLATAGAATRVQLLQEIASLRADSGDLAGALQRRLEAFAEDPQDESNRADLERLAEQSGRWDQLADALWRFVVAEPESPIVPEVLRKLTRIDEERLDEKVRAIEGNEELLKREPENLDVLRTLARLYRGARAPQRLAEVLKQLAAREPSPEAQVQLLLELAPLAEQQLSDYALAVECLRGALSRAPGQARAAEELMRLLSAAGRHEELAALLEERVAGARKRGAEDEAIELTVRLAQLRHQQLGAPEAAIGLLSEVLRERPAHPQAVAALEDLLRVPGPGRAPAAALLEPVFQAASDHARLVEVLDIRAEAETDPSAQAALWRRIAQIQAARLKNPQLAFVAAARVLRASPDDLAALELCRQYADEAGADEELAAALEEIAPKASTPAARAALMRALGELREADPAASFDALCRAFDEAPQDGSLDARLEELAAASGARAELAKHFAAGVERVGKSPRGGALCVRLAALEEASHAEEGAVSWFERALELDPTLEELVLPELDRLFVQLQAWSELAEVLERRTDRAGKGEVPVALLTRLGAVREEKLNDPARALRCFERVLAADPHNDDAAAALERLYEAAGDHAHLLEILTRRRAQAAGAERESLALKMADVCQRGLKDPQRAIELYREVLADSPRCEPAFAKLRDLLDAQGQHEDLRELLQARIARTLEPKELVGLHEKLAELYWKRFDKPAQAAEHFRAAIERDPKRESAWRALVQLYEGLDRPAELAEAVRELAVLQEGTAEGAQQRIRLAEVLAAQPSRRAEALNAARRALTNKAVARAELERLRALFLKLDSPPDAAQVLERKADLDLEAGEPQVAIAALFELVELWNKVGEPLKGGPHLERVLKIAPDHRQAYEAALALYGKHGRWLPYAEVARGFLPHLDEDARFTALLDLASVQQDRLQDGRSALASLGQALALRPSEAALLERACRQADLARGHAELARELGQLLGQLPGGPDAARIALKLADLQDQKLDDPKAAEATLRKLIDAAGGDARALEQLGALLSRRGEHARYREVLEQKVEAAETAADRQRILREIAAISEQPLRDVAGAAQALRRAIELGPDRELLTVLVELHRRHEQWREAAAALAELRDLLRDQSACAAVQLEIGEIFEKRLKQDAEAVEAYRAVLELDPRQREALEALERLYRKQDRPAELLRIHERQLELVKEGAQRLKLLFQCAALHERLGDASRADACLEAVLGQEPGNLTAIKDLERLRRAQGKWKELAAVLERHLPHGTSAAERAALSVELGELYREKLAEPDRAAACFGRALELDATCRPAIKALCAIHEQRRDWRKVVDLLLKDARLAAGAEAVAQLGRAAQLSLEELRDAPGAKRAWQKALEIDSAHLPTIRALRDQYERERDWPKYEQLLIAEADCLRDPAEKGRASLEVARHFEARRGDLEAARKWYEKALGLMPGSSEAADPLAELAVARKDWKAARQMLDLVVTPLQARQKKGERGVAAELARALHRLGRVCREAGLRKEALAALEQATQLDPALRPALEDYAAVLEDAGRAKEALQLFERLLTTHRAKLDNAELVALHCRIGQLNETLAQKDAARTWYERALVLAPASAPALRALAKLAEDGARYREAADLRQRLVRALDGDERFEAYVALGDLAASRLRDQPLAIDSYVQALAMKPGELAVMQDLLAAYRETRQWHPALKLVGSMLAHPSARSSPEKLKRLHLAVGEIAGGEMGDLERAVTALNAALDLDCRFLDAFKQLEVLLTRHKRWRLLEESYQKMIDRLRKTGLEAGGPAGVDPAQLVALWRALGDLRAGPMKAADAAMEAYRAAAELVPDDAAAQEALAEFASQRKGGEAVALAAWRRALARTEHTAKACRAIGELAAKLGELDSVYLAAQTFDGLLKDAEAQKVLGAMVGKARPPAKARKTLSDRHWRTLLLDRRVRGPLGELFGVLWEQAGSELAQAPSDLGIAPKKHRLELGGAGFLRSAEVKAVCQLLELESLALYSPFLSGPTEAKLFRKGMPAPDQELGVEMCATWPASLRLGGRYFDGKDRAEAMCELAYWAAFARPELALTRAMPQERLQAVLEAALSIVDESAPTTVGEKALKKERKLIEKSLSESSHVALSTVAKKVLADKARPDLATYLAGAQLTGARAALFASAEVRAFKTVVLDGGLLDRVPGKGAARELLTFALGGELGALRAAVGMQVAGGEPTVIGRKGAPAP